MITACANQRYMSLFKESGTSGIQQFTQRFLRGVRSVPGYMDSLCHSCTGSCGGRPDDQCLISAWGGYIQGAFDHGHDAEEAGRRCATAQLQRREQYKSIQLPCEINTGA